MHHPSERREMRRFHIHLPARVTIEEDGFQEFITETRNVSARGVFFYLERSLTPGSKIEFILTFPPELTFTQSIRVKFTGKVVRVEDALPPAPVGIAAAIDNYEFLSESAIV